MGCPFFGVEAGFEYEKMEEVFPRSEAMIQLSSDEINELALQQRDILNKIVERLRNPERNKRFLEDKRAETTKPTLFK